MSERETGPEAPASYDPRLGRIYESNHRVSEEIRKLDLKYEKMFRIANKSVDDHRLQQEQVECWAQLNACWRELNGSLAANGGVFEEQVDRLDRLNGNINDNTKRIRELEARCRGLQLGFWTILAAMLLLSCFACYLISTGSRDVRNLDQALSSLHSEIKLTEGLKAQVDLQKAQLMTIEVTLKDRAK
jgi:hypothetical protein